MLAIGVSEEAFGLCLHEASRGRPLGGEEFFDDLEQNSGHELRPSPVGRPRKHVQEDSRQIEFGIGVGVYSP